MASFRVANTSIKQIEFAPKKKDVFLVNTADRVIRVYDSQEVLTCGVNGEPEPIQRLQDLVNKTTWKKCCFAGGPDADYICAGSARQHSIYVWERSIGTLVKILHGTKGETLLDVVWHPLRPIICSISSGVVSVWAQAQVENWSAFAPDFKEMDENVDYEERESEFDLDDEDRSPSRLALMEKDKRDEDVNVDVTTCHPTSYYISSDEDEEVEKQDLIYLPVSLEIDEPENTEPVVVLQDPIPGKSKDVKAIDINLDAAVDESVPPASRQSVSTGRGSTNNGGNSSRNRSQSSKRAASGTDASSSKKRKSRPYDEY